jgi:hypothetical protein
MEKLTNSQLDLFSQSSLESGLKPDARNPLFLRIWNYEKAILIVIGVLLVAIFSFTLGVERGKSVILSRQNKPDILAVAKVSPDKPLVSTVTQETVIKKPEVLSQASTMSVNQGSFTIQVASFKTRDNALKEAEILKKKGFSTSILNRGNYSVLCVGNFPNKETAQPLLSELNKRYKSCYIRRL